MLRRFSTSVASITCAPRSLAVVDVIVYSFRHKTSNPDYPSAMASVWLLPFQCKPGTCTPKDVVPLRQPKENRHTLLIDIYIYGLISIDVIRRVEGRAAALRPYVIPFLREMHKLFEVIYWTSAHEVWGRPVLEAIERVDNVLRRFSTCIASTTSCSAAVRSPALFGAVVSVRHKASSADYPPSMA